MLFDEYCVLLAVPTSICVLRCRWFLWLLGVLLSCWSVSSGDERRLVYAVLRVCVLLFDAYVCAACLLFDEYCVLRCCCSCCCLLFSMLLLLFAVGVLWSVVTTGDDWCMLFDEYVCCCSTSMCVCCGVAGSCCCCLACCCCWSVSSGDERRLVYAVQRVCVPLIDEYVCATCLLFDEYCVLRCCCPVPVPVPVVRHAVGCCCCRVLWSE